MVELAIQAHKNVYIYIYAMYAMYVYIHTRI